MFVQRNKKARLPLLARVYTPEMYNLLRNTGRQEENRDDDEDSAQQQA
jgi:hypothetical protein